MDNLVRSSINNINKWVQQNVVKPVQNWATSYPQRTITQMQQRQQNIQNNPVVKYLAKPYIENNLIKPFGTLANQSTQFMQNIGSQNYKGALGNAGQVGLAGLRLGANLNPVSSIGYSAYQGLKSQGASRNRGESIPQSLEAMRKGFVGEDFSGVGSALTKIKPLETALNVGEQVAPWAMLGYNVYKNIKNATSPIKDASGKELQEVDSYLGEANKKGRLAIKGDWKIQKIGPNGEDLGFTKKTYKWSDEARNALHRMELEDGIKYIIVDPKRGTMTSAYSTIDIPKEKVKMTSDGKIKTNAGNIKVPEMGFKAKPVEMAGDPVQNVIDALKGAEVKRGQQEALYSAERASRFAKFEQAGAGTTGQAGALGQLGQLKGEMPKVQYKPLNVKQSDVDAIFNKVKDANILNAGEKATGYNALLKLFGEKGTSLPTEGELKILNQVLPQEFIDTVLEKRPLMEKLLSEGKAALNLPRAMMATADMSAPLRQGAFLIGRPKQWIPAFKDMFKYAFSEDAYKGLQQEIQSRPNYDLYKQTKLGITEMTTLGPREEAFMSNLAEKIPGFGALAKMSNRAYSGFLSKLRVDVFDDIYKSAIEAGADNPRLADSLARFVNSATGRASLASGIERNSEFINGLFFSPRLMKSRIDLLNPFYYARLDPFVRKEALKSLFTFAGTAVTALSLAKLAGASVEADPRSSDFGKIKTGNIRYDILAGFGQYIRLAAQLVTQTSKTVTGEIKKFGTGPFDQNTGSTISRFVESKEAPVASFITGLMKGKNFLGEDFNVPVEVVNRLTPMLYQDMYDIAKDKGSMLSGILLGSPAIFGVSTADYGTKEPYLNTTPTGKTTVKFKNPTGLSEDIVNKITGKQPEGKIADTSLYQTYIDKQTRDAQIEAIKQKAMTGDMSKVGNFVPINDKGTIKVIDTSWQPEIPALTGNTELDKKAISDYKGEITKKINEIYDLYKAGQISAEDANNQIAKLKDISTAYSSSSSSTKKGKNKSIAKVSFGKVRRVAAPKGAKITIPKLPKLKSISKKSFKVKKLKASKQPKIKVKIPKP